MSSSSVQPTNYPAIKNAPLAGLAEGNGYFSNYHLAAVVVVVPYILKTILPLFNRGGFKTYLFLLILSGVPTTVAYWTLASMYGARKNEKVTLPGKNIEEYITINDPELAKLYNGKNKIPMQVLHDAFFDGKIDIKGTHSRRSGMRFTVLTTFLGDVLETLDFRHDFTKMTFTLELFKHVFFKLIPDVISHSQEQDQEQVQEHYDRTLLPKVYWSSLTLILQEAMTSTDGLLRVFQVNLPSLIYVSRFLGPRMIYTSGIILDPNTQETLEQLQDNKLAVVCSKLDLKPTDKYVLPFTSSLLFVILLR